MQKNCKRIINTCGTVDKIKHMKIIKITSLTLGCLLAGQGVMAKKEQKKNLLFIITDQQRYDALSIAGNTVLETPNLDRLAKQGAYFQNAYTPCAVCAPARSSILTGHTVKYRCKNE